MIHYIEGNELLTEILKIKKLVLVEFYMPNSIPCETQNNTLKEIEKIYNEKIEVFKINIDETPEMKIMYNITALPTILIFKDNEELERKTGNCKYEDILRCINELI